MIFSQTSLVETHPIVGVDHKDGSKEGVGVHVAAYRQSSNNSNRQPRKEVEYIKLLRMTNLTGF